MAPGCQGIDTLPVNSGTCQSWSDDCTLRTCDDQWWRDAIFRRLRQRAYLRWQQGRTITERIVFVQSAGSGAYDEDQRLAECLREHLGQRFEVHYPRMLHEETRPTRSGDR